MGPKGKHRAGRGYTDGMKRWIARIIACLILITGGAITTVAVAWG
jgi:hypothetical protein